MLDSILQDLRFAVRSLSRRPLFLAVPVLSLAIGIGANTAIFSVVDRYLIQAPAGIPNAGRMVELGRGDDGHGFDSFSYPDFLELRKEAGPLEALAGYTMQMLTLSRGEEGDRAFGMLVSANYFELLGVRPALGRAFLPEEDEGADEHPVVVLGHTYWEDRLGGDPDVVGSTLYVSRQPYTVVGIAPEGFRGHFPVADPDVYVPLVQHPSLNEGRNYLGRRGASWFQVLGLLRTGASLEEANAAVATVFSRLAEEHPETNGDRTASVRAFGTLPAAVRGPAGMFLGALMAFVGLLLLITCTNVAGIFLARASGRRKEIAIRLSVGSGRGRLIRHLLTESLLVFSLGGVGGVFLAVWGLDLLASFDLPAPVPIRLDLSPDLGAVAFAGALTLLTGLVFGLLPARQALDLDLLGTLKDEGARGGSSEGRLRRGFVAAQVGASVVLLAASGLLLRALQRAGEIETGFEAGGAYITFLDLKTEGLEAQEGKDFQDEVLAYFAARPWVESVALSIDLPLDLGSHGTGVVPEGWRSTDQEEYVGIGFNSVSREYFTTLRIPVLEGRVFEATDAEGAPAVAVVSRAFVDRVWPGQSPLGRRVLWGTEGEHWLTIVGVVEDVQNQMLTDSPEPFLYMPLRQHYGAENNLVIRSAADPALVARELTAGLRALDPRISLSPVIDLERYTAVGTLPQRIAGIVATTLGFLALLLSGMGVYGVMASTVTRRTREMGIRVALGAEPGWVLRSVLLGALRLALPGLAVGAILAAGVGVLMRNLLLGMNPLDPLAIGGVALAVVGMVLAGTVVPALRAAEVDPAEALRHE